MVTSAEIWSARRAKATAETPADKARRGWDAYRDGPHRKAAPKKPAKRQQQPEQLWATADRKPPAGWEPIDVLCKRHGIWAIYHPDIGIGLRDRSVPEVMHAATPDAARKCIAVILSRRTAR